MPLSNTPAISVIIPAFNHENYITTCLNSLNDAYTGLIEVIICDDFSNDKTVDKIEIFIEENLRNNINIKLIKHISNMGVTTTLNHCLREVTSDYIYVIASDDFIVKNGLTIAMQKLLNDNVDAVISDCHVVNDRNEIIFESAFLDYRKSSLSRLRKNIKDELVFNWVVPGPSLLIRKDVYKDIGLYNENLMAEDRDFYLRLISQKKTIFNESCIACYRVHDSNFSKNEVYQRKKELEFARVNYSYFSKFNGVCRLYLMSYKLDLTGWSSISNSLRKMLKLCYYLMNGIYR